MVRSRLLTHLYQARALARTKILEQLLYVCARFDLPAAAAWLIHQHVVAAPGGGHTGGATPVKVLVLSKPGFSEDVQASLCQDRKFAVYTMNRRVFKALARAFLPAKIDDNNYLSDSPEVDAAKAAYRGFLKRLWTALKRYAEFDAVLTGNFAYFAERELGGALEALGVPFIVLHKENLKSSGRRSFWEMVYRTRRGPFSGRKILVYNQVERQLQIDAGIISPELVAVTGMPRLDRVHRWRQTYVRCPDERVIKNQVLFFFFGSKTGLPFLARKSKVKFEKLGDEVEHLSWQQLAQGCQAMLVRFAAQSPEVRVVIKAKSDKRSLAALLAFRKAFEPLPPNVEVVAGGDPFDLIVESKVIVGFNTNGLLEAIAAGKPVVVPRFAEAAEEKMQIYIADFEDAVSYADSPEALSQLLRHKIRVEPRDVVHSLTPARRAILEAWAGNADGRAGDRVRRMILDEVGPRPLRTPGTTCVAGGDTKDFPAVAGPHYG